jgi:hypothetical protein
VPLVHRRQHVQRPAGGRGGLAELLKAVVHPVQEEDLALELALAGRDDFVQVVALTQMLELGVIVSVELEPLRVLAFHVGQGVELGEDALPSARTPSSAGSAR